MTDAEKREAARQFSLKWNGKGREEEDGRSYWIDLLQNVLGLEDVIDRIEFEKKVVGYDGNMKKIDAYIPETKVLIEQKSLGVSLEKPQAGHGGKTPYEQAKEYADGLPYNEKPRWIVLCDFAEIRIYDMDQKKPWENIITISLMELQTKYPLLSFLYKDDVKKITEEMELSLKAGELIGKIHDRFLDQYHDPMAKKTQNSLNILCVRLVFCLYAEDAGLFGETDAFKKYIVQYEPKDIRQALITLFEVLNTPTSERADLYLSDELEAFPYVNGGLFERKNIVIPKVTDEIKQVLIESALFDWSKISPAIFGAVFESTLNPETRRAGGMHFTSHENLHRVIDPLFLDDLKAELETIKQRDGGVRTRMLRAFQKKIASLTFLDPACGSGNFLTETYICLRRLENEIIRLLQKTEQIQMDLDGASPIQVKIDHFYGIEINDFAVTVAKTALWIAESQMMEETKRLVWFGDDFLPIRTQAHIEEGNALQMDWNHVIPAAKLDYIMGNPPFVGKKEQTKKQKEELISVIGKGIAGIGNLDYVVGWYVKASDMLQKNRNIIVAFVSTNSITQGEQAPTFGRILEKCKVSICFAYRSFVWDSEANDKAHVHCVIIGFSSNNMGGKIYLPNSDAINVKTINHYLIEAPPVFIENRSTPICSVTKMSYGSMPIDDGHLILNKDDVDAIITENPKCSSYIRKYAGGAEILKNKKRWCLWLVNANPKEIKKSKTILERIAATAEFRSKSNRPQTLALAETPMLFGEIRQPNTPMLVVPKVSSENRRYIPIAFITPDIIINGSALIVPNATIYDFGILISNIHMSWMRCVAGRMKSDYQYSNKIVYNNFVWPNPTEEQRAKIEVTAQGILDARALYPDSSLADLYDPLTMPPELLKAHQRNDAAVMRAYGFDIKSMTEADCVAELMKMYQQITTE